MSDQHCISREVRAKLLDTEGLYTFLVDEHMGALQTIWSNIRGVPEGRKPCTLSEWSKKAMTAYGQRDMSSPS